MLLSQEDVAVSFTGTQRGMTHAQKLEVGRLIAESTTIHHGDCIGADAEAHHLAVSNGLRTVIHPPADSSRRAYLDADVIYKPKDYLQRNHDIVDAGDHLVAAPNGPERLRSGTWATIRYARKRGKAIYIVMPDGSIAQEG
jgi:hypothetical protein